MYAKKQQLIHYYKTWPSFISPLEYVLLRCNQYFVCVMNDTGGNGETSSPHSAPHSCHRPFSTGSVPSQSRLARKC